MAVFQSIKNLFLTEPVVLPRHVIPAPATDYQVRPVRQRDLFEIARLNLRCFRQGEHYSKQTFNYLLNEPRSLSFKAETIAGEIVGFIFVLINQDGAGHITTLGVAPEHRRRGIAAYLLQQLENAMRSKLVTTVVLEVRVSNDEAQNLYRKAGYSIVQRVERYYNDGEDGYLMMRSMI